MCATASARRSRFCATRSSFFEIVVYWALEDEEKNRVKRQSLSLSSLFSFSLFHLLSVSLSLSHLLSLSRSSLSRSSRT